jgi:hypothetical protein
MTNSKEINEIGWHFTNETARLGLGSQTNLVKLQLTVHGNGSAGTLLHSLQHALMLWIIYTQPTGKNKNRPQFFAAR